jgi:selenocysteine lyase/cysteine desulfurase
MTLKEILGDEALRQHEFPVTRNEIFLSHAAVCPLPRRVIEAMTGYLHQAGCQDQESAASRTLLHDTRALAARLIGAQPGEIALVGPTSLALSFIAAGLPLGKTDNILVYQDDYPSNVYPWMALAGNHVEVRFLNVRALGRIRLRDVQGQVDENTRLVALSSCHFISGWRCDIPAIGAFLHERRIAFCVDGIQTVGAFPTPVTHVDFLAADAHKWMLGPASAGILYVRKEWHRQLRPIVHGWHNVSCPDFVARDTLDFKPDARRYEAGTANLAGMAGLKAALELLLEIGIETIAAELHRKRAWLVPALQAKGYTVLEADSPDDYTGGMISFDKSGADMGGLQDKLATHRVVAALRKDRAGNRYLRISPHFYNTDDELNRFLDLI